MHLVLLCHKQCNFWDTGVIMIPVISGKSFMIDADIETGSSPRFISVISGELSCQLNSGILKTARRFALFETICNVISEFAHTKRAERYLMIDNQAAKTCSVLDRMVLVRNSRDFIHALNFFVPQSHCRLLF
ncbi:hypothetical protein OIU85_001238 [Salix viminalis]|uniref:Uncharacterized protein n=1 Tax=Salix viminalis TaxID=40686 RepID=A0A9Q0VLL7_SALVM|nr:hypothetical protein OIU85_001238 [Salix viminalis]